MKRKKIIAATIILLLACASVFITTCQMAVDEAVRSVSIMDPYISKQPLSYSYFVGEMPEIPKLSIEIKDWDDNDGSLSYQWYTFDDIEDYIKTGGTAIEGANGLEYTPTAVKQAKDDRNYFYVKVTNDNPRINVGEKTKTVQSEVAVIAFSDTSFGLAPIISAHPGSAVYQAGRDLNTLNVRAAARSDRTGFNPMLSYQWYEVPITTDADGNVTAVGEAVEIPNATSPFYDPDPTKLRFGKNFFLVVITSVESVGSAIQVSVPALINIVPGARAIAPTITAQPRDYMFFTGDTLANITVAGVSRDNGTITYQWYENAGPALNAETATAVGGEVDTGVFAPPINTTAELTKYYFAKVKNTNEYVISDETTAAVNSKVVKVSVVAPGSLAANLTVTVADPRVKSNRYQYVRGFGGMDVAWANFPEQKPEDMETMYNPDKLGYNINRIMISPGKVDPTEGIQDLLNGSRPNYYENVKIVNKYGGYNLASPWSPPKEWKSNNSINGGGFLQHEYYKQYAAYLKSFAQHMYNRGAPIYCISIQNEPNYTAGYDGCTARRFSPFPFPTSRTIPPVTTDANGRLTRCGTSIKKSGVLPKACAASAAAGRSRRCGPSTANRPTTPTSTPPR